MIIYLNALFTRVRRTPDREGRLRMPQSTSPPPLPASPSPPCISICVFMVMCLAHLRARLRGTLDARGPLLGPRSRSSPPRVAEVSHQRIPSPSRRQLRRSLLLLPLSAVSPASVRVEPRAALPCQAGRCSSHTVRACAGASFSRLAHTRTAACLSPFPSPATPS